MRILITGGSGFIGTALIRHLLKHTDYHILNLDKLTYAGTRKNAGVVASPRYRFVHGDICDRSLVRDIIGKFQPEVITHLAAESHVDRSITGPDAFVRTNLVGTYTMVSEAFGYWKNLPSQGAERFRFHHISTDEVYGSLGPTGMWSESSAYDPRSPYSATKAGSDHLVSAWGHTFGLPILITNCSNNYGPFQYPEKLIPRTIVRALTNRTLPIYGTGDQIRDWLHVNDHVRALQQVFEQGKPGQKYNIGGDEEQRNIDVVRELCSILDDLRPRRDGTSFSSKIRHVEDRPGHDERYAMDASKIRQELGWEPAKLFSDGLRETVEWYLREQEWWQPVAALV